MDRSLRLAVNTVRISVGYPIRLMSDFFLPSAGGTRSPKVSSVQALRHDWLEFPVVAVAFSGPAVGGCEYTD